MPLARMTSVHLRVSSFRNRANSSGVKFDGSAPCAASFSRTSGAASARTTSSRKVLMASFGVPFEPEPVGDDVIDSSSRVPGGEEDELAPRRVVQVLHAPFRRLAEKK